MKVKGFSTRRHLLKLAVWTLPSFAIAQTPQQSTARSNNTIAFGEPFLLGFYRGNDFRKLPEPEKTAYLMGMWDGYMFAPAIGGKAKNDQTLHNCVPDLEPDQLLAIVKKYMDEHPERWGDSMNVIVFNALPPD